MRTEGVTSMELSLFRLTVSWMRNHNILYCLNKNRCDKKLVCTMCAKFKGWVENVIVVEEKLFQ